MKSQKPWESPKGKKKGKSGKPGSGDVSKRYTLPAAAVEAIKEAAAEYRSRGRVVQVAAELPHPHGPSSRP
jgi:hypothetical protein